MEFYKISNKLAQDQSANRGPEFPGVPEVYNSEKIEGEPDAGIITPFKEPEKAGIIGEKLDHSE